MTTDAPENPSGLWLSLAEIARRKGVTRQAIALRVARLEDGGSLSTRPGKGGTKLVNLAEFDRLSDEQTNFAKLDGARTAREGQPARSRRAAYNDAITEKAQYDAELKRIELAERKRELVHVGDLKQVAEDCASAVVEVIEGLVRRAEEIDAAARAGQTRQLLRTIARDMRTRIAEEYRKMLKIREAQPGSAVQPAQDAED